MKTILLSFIILVNLAAFSQDHSAELNKNWQFSKAGTKKWHPAIVPGTVHTDLRMNRLIPDPFFSDNEKGLQWIDSCDWVYRSFFTWHPSPEERGVQIYFRGLDTYADVFINGRLMIKADNMFHPWQADLGAALQRGRNEVKIIFHSAQRITDSIAKTKLPLVYPDNNRVFARKAQFQFGWDWGPKFISCGIWKPVSLYSYSGELAEPNTPTAEPFAKLIQKKDSIGETFYFEKDGKPLFVKGANWIPANIFLPGVKSSDYLALLLRAKNANMNMLRVWGGGIYEDDYFYRLCDSLGIMVWQDLMFAGGMYPADKKFLKNVKEEIKYQVERLREHPSIVLWCGNNEIDEAWHNWGWQQQFNLHDADSARISQEYKTLFEDSLRKWVNEYDVIRPYISSSPRHGWGRKESLTEGDSHYWGLWWGLEPWEAFETHTGRFVSEYGMQSMPNFTTVKKYVPGNDLRMSSRAIQHHQKANEGFKKLNFYLDKYFLDSAKLKVLSVEEYTYISQCLQYYILRNSIAIHRSKEPRNMGTLLWQLNDCWPATSWSITDFNREPKAAWYAVKEAYRDDIRPRRDSISPKNLHLQKPMFTLHPIGESRFTIESNTAAKFVFISSGREGFSDNYFDLAAGEKKIISVNDRYLPTDLGKIFKIISLYDILFK